MKRYNPVRIVKRVINLTKKGILFKKIYRRFIYEIKKRNFKPFIIKKRFEHLKFPFYIGNLEGLEWYILNFESKKSYELEFITKRILKEGDTIFEVGSHHGYSTIILSKTVGEKGKIYAFEPFPENVRILKRNIEINNLNNVEVIDKAIGSSEGEIIIYGSDGINRKNKEKAYKSKIIPLNRYKDIKIDAIKIDVEGYECEVLEGAKEILKKNPNLILEIHAKNLYKCTVNDLLGFIKTLKNKEFYIQWEEWEKPQFFNFDKPINKRVHFFAIDKTTPFK